MGRPVRRTHVAAARAMRQGEHYSSTRAIEEAMRATDRPEGAPSDEDLIADYLRTRGVTRCPPR